MQKRAMVGALEIAYDEVGAGERPFVIVHGFTGSRDDFADVLESIGAPDAWLGTIHSHLKRVRT